MPKLALKGKDMLAIFDIEYEFVSEPITKFCMNNLDKALTLIIVKGDIEKNS
jgi:hypothetical protein